MHKITIQIRVQGNTEHTARDPSKRISSSPLEFPANLCTSIQNKHIWADVLNPTVSQGGDRYVFRLYSFRSILQMAELDSVARPP